LGFFHFLLPAVASDKAYQLLAHGRWFSPAPSTTKTDRHDIAEILLKVALSTNQRLSRACIIVVRMQTSTRIAGTCSRPFVTNNFNPTIDDY
jgi:hypothetical protein